MCRFNIFSDCWETSFEMDGFLFPWERSGPETGAGAGFRGCPSAPFAAVVEGAWLPALVAMALGLLVPVAASKWEVGTRKSGGEDVSMPSKHF